MKKQFYRRNLPHYNTSGHDYFVTWNLLSSIPKNVLKENSIRMKMAKMNLQQAISRNFSNTEIESIKDEIYALKRSMQKNIERILHFEKNSEINLCKQANLFILLETLQYWDNQKIENIAWSIMPNHVHWVFHLKNKDIDGNVPALQDVLQSVKKYTARKINEQENRRGNLWTEENYDTTIRNEKQLYNVVNYTLNNPVKAKLSKSWSDWKGNYINEKYIDMIE